MEAFYDRSNSTFEPTMFLGDHVPPLKMGSSSISISSNRYRYRLLDIATVYSISSECLIKIVLHYRSANHTNWRGGAAVPADYGECSRTSRGHWTTHGDAFSIFFQGSFLGEVKGSPNEEP